MPARDHTTRHHTWLEKRGQTDLSAYHAVRPTRFSPLSPMDSPLAGRRRQANLGYAALSHPARRDFHSDRRTLAPPASVTRIGPLPRDRPFPGPRRPVRPSASSLHAPPAPGCLPPPLPLRLPASGAPYAFSAAAANSNRPGGMIAASFHRCRWCRAANLSPPERATGRSRYSGYIRDRCVCLHLARWMRSNPLGIGGARSFTCWPSLVKPMPFR